MNPFNSLITRWRNMRRDRAEGEASRRQIIQSIETARENKRNRIKDRKRIEAEILEKEQRQKIEALGNRLWEADGKPTGKEDYYKQLAKDKIGEKIPFPYKIYYSLEKTTLEPVESWLDKQAFFTILGRVGNLAIAIALISFIANEDTRHNNQVFTAWQTITSANGQTGSGGRIQAIEFLNSRPLKFPWIGWTTDTFWDESEQICKEKTIWGLRRNREILDGLSAPDAYLSRIKLCGASLEGANLQKVSLWDVKLQEAYLPGANLQEAFLAEANLQEAFLAEADLQEAYLAGANLQEAFLAGANLQEANLEGVRNLTYQQIKLSCNWKQAIFFGKWSPEKEKYIAKEPDNTNFIKQIEAEKASDSLFSPNCDRWNKQ